MSQKKIKPYNHTNHPGSSFYPKAIEITIIALIVLVPIACQLPFILAV